jgi:hypothetical protein
MPQQRRFSASFSVLTGLALLTLAPCAFSQITQSSADASTTSRNILAESTLPDAPSALFAPAGSSSSADSDAQDQNPQVPLPPQPGQPSTSVKPVPVERGIFGLGYSDAYRASHEASTTDKYILPGQLAPKLDRGDKIELGLIHGVSAYSILGWFTSAGYSHVINTTPNYGTDSGAFGQRLGASALRSYSTEILKDSVAANVFHQDPRYYKMGPRKNVAIRTIYAVTRTLVTRGDDGKLAPNYSLLAGNAVGAALTNAYYPNVDRGFDQTAKTFGSAMYGSAFSFFAAEFLSGALEAVHLRQARY